MLQLEVLKKRNSLHVLNTTILSNYLDEPTRCRGDDEPHTIDLIFSQDENISDIEYQCPVGKSDHAVVKFNYHCYFISRERQHTRLCYDKADYAAMEEKARKIDWESEQHNEMNNEQMWDVFHSKVKHLEDEFVPKKIVKAGNIKNHSFKRDENTRNYLKRSMLCQKSW